MVRYYLLTHSDTEQMQPVFTSLISCCEHTDPEKGANMLKFNRSVLRIALLCFLAVRLVEAVEIHIPDMTTENCDSFTVPITVSDFTGIAGLEIHLSYDDLQVTFDTVISSVLTSATTNGGGGAVHIIWEDFMNPLSLLNGDTLAEIGFLTLVDSTDVLFVGNNEVVDETGDPQPLTVFDGSVNCAPTVEILLTMPDYVSPTCDSACLPIIVENFVDVAGVELHLSYNAADMSCDSIDPGKLVGATVNCGSGEAHIIWEDFIDPLTCADGDTLINVCFVGLIEFASPVSFQATCELVDDLGNPLAVTYTDGSLSCNPECSINISTPNGGETWYIDSTYDIVWSSEYCGGFVDIDFSIDNGASWGAVTVSEADLGVYSWTIPNFPSEQCLMRVCESGGTSCDTSDAVFSIEPAPSDSVYLDVPEVGVTVCDSGYLPITVDGLVGAAGVELHLTYDQLCMTCDTVISNYLTGATINCGAGEVHIVWEDFLNPISPPNGDTLASICFTELSPDTCSLCVTGAELVDELGNPFDLAVDSCGLIWCDDTCRSWYVSTTGDDLTGDGTFGSPFATIQKGIDEAGTCDTVKVFAGDYEYATALIIEKGISVVSILGKEVTTIRATGSDRVFTLNSSADTINIDGFRITNGNPSGTAYGDWGGGVLINTGCAVIENCEIDSNYTPLSSGAGIASRPGCYVEIRNCRIHDNTAATVGGGIVMNEPTGGVIEYCVIDNNIATSNGGGIFLFASANSGGWVDIINNTIAYNENGFQGAGIEVRRVNTRIHNNIVAFNSPTDSINCPSTAGVWASLCSLCISCNDVYMNCCGNNYHDAGDVLLCPETPSFPPGLNDFSLDPQFCATPDSLYYYLKCNSPCLPASNACTVLIGALGEGCCQEAYDSLLFPSTTATEPCDTSYDGNAVQTVAIKISQPVLGMTIPVKFPSCVKSCSVSTDGYIDSLWQLEVVCDSTFCGEEFCDTVFTVINLFDLSGDRIEPADTPIPIADIHFMGYRECTESRYVKWDTCLSSHPNWSLLFVDTTHSTFVAEFDYYRDSTEILDYLEGDCNNDGDTTINDLIFLIDRLYRGGPDACVKNTMDVNGDCNLDISDITFYVAFLYGGGNKPRCGCIYSCTESRTTKPSPDMMSSLITNATHAKDSTTIDMSTVESIFGIELLLKGTGNANPSKRLGEAFEMFSHSADGYLKIGLFDLEGAETMEPGKYPLLTLSGNWELVSATVSDMNHTAWSAKIRNNDDQLLPDAYVLHQNVPNPFNPTTEIRFELPKAGHVTLDVFNVVGQRVKTLVDNHLETGAHAIIWNGTDDQGGAVSSGVYFYRLTAGEFVDTKKMLLLK